MDIVSQVLSIGTMTTIPLLELPVRPVMQPLIINAFLVREPHQVDDFRPLLIPAKACLLDEMAGPL